MHELSPIDSSQPLLLARIERVISDSNVDQRDKDGDESAHNATIPYKLAFLRKVQPIAQNGPQCGLVALKMAGDYLSIPDSPSVEEIFNKAKSLNFTHHGEIFSVDWMSILATSIYPRPATVIDIRPLGSKASSFILKSLLDFKCLLVPYDADKNNEPCCNSGHSAHWALICGFLIVDTSISELGIDPSDQTCQCFNFNCPISTLCFLNTPCDAHRQAFEQFFDKLNQFDPPIYVFALQGKSKHAGVWRIGKLIASNAYLRELCPTRVGDNLEYKVPDEGVGGGLGGKVLVLG